MPDFGDPPPVDSLVGTYWNDYATDIVVAPDAAGLRVKYANGVEDVLVMQSDGVYALPGTDEAIVFERDKASGRWLLHLYLDDRWALTAHGKELDDE